MTAIHYKINIPDDTPNVDISTFLAPCTAKSSSWWSGIKPLDYGARTMKEWFFNALTRDPGWQRSVPNTIKVCPGIGDLFKRSYLVKWPCDTLLGIQGMDDGNYTYYFRIPDGQTNSILEIDSHNVHQWRSSTTQIYEGMLNLKVKLPVKLSSSKIAPLLPVNPDYHHSSFPYQVMPGVITLGQPGVSLDLNINLMFELPDPGDLIIHEFKEGDVLCYLTLLNHDKTVPLKEKNVMPHYRKSFIRGSYNV